MMPAAGPPPASFYLYSLLFTFITWALFGLVYGKLGNAIKEKDPARKGLIFGGLVFLVAGLPGTLTMYLLINLPAGLLAAWAITSLILHLIGGVVAAKAIKPE